MKDVMYESDNQYVIPHTSFLYLFNRIVDILHEYRTEKGLIKLASEDPKKAIKIASMILTASSIEAYGPIQTLIDAVEKIRPLVPKMLLAAYAILYCTSTNKDKDVLLEMVYSMLRETYTDDFIQDAVNKCGCYYGEALASCIYGLTKDG